MGYGRQTWHSFRPPSWMCHLYQTGCSTRVNPNRKEAISSISAQFHYTPERNERVQVGGHCVKVKGRAELKIEKNLLERPLVTISPNYLIPTPTLSVLTSTYAKLTTGLGHRKVKNRTKSFPGKFGRGVLNLVALALTVTELFNKVCEKV